MMTSENSEIEGTCVTCGADVPTESSWVAVGCGCGAPCSVKCADCAWAVK